ncbi:MAG: sortase [bacterium]|nr:sortase [bacterium]
MEWLIYSAARLVRAVKNAWEKKWSFPILFLCVFGVSVALLAHFDLLPNAVPVVAETVPANSSLSAGGVASETAEVPEYPMKIVAETIGLSASIANPASTDIGVLDAALLSGAVRYPTSAKLGENGTVVVFGHSSYLPIVHNPAYKTFDGIQDLKKGDVLTVYSSTRVYTYTVKSVAKESATSNAAIPLTVTGRTLTLVTCDSFGTKSDRFVVTAEFVESHTIST